MAVLRFLLYANIWVALCAASITYYLILKGWLTENYNYLSLSFFSTLLAYNLQRFIKFKQGIKMSEERYLWLQKNMRLLVALMVVALFGSAISMLLITTDILFYIYCVPPAGLVFWYAYKSKKIKPLRELPYSKAIIIAVVWVFSLVYFPFWLDGFVNTTSDSYRFMFYIFFWVYALCIPFDSKDKDYDFKQMKTLPQLLGEKKATLVGVLLCMVMATIAFSFSSYLLIVCFIYSAIILLLSQKYKSELWIGIFVDGALTVPVLLKMLEFPLGL